MATSLWRIADRETQHLMTEYYRRLSAGEGRVAAMDGAGLGLFREGSSDRHGEVAVPRGARRVARLGSGWLALEGGAATLTVPLTEAMLPGVEVAVHRRGVDRTVEGGLDRFHPQAQHCERRPQLMRHIGDEGLLSADQGLEAGGHLVEGGREAAQFGRAAVHRRPAAQALQLPDHPTAVDQCGADPHRQRL